MIIGRWTILNSQEIPSSSFGKTHVIGIPFPELESNGLLGQSNIHCSTHSAVLLILSVFRIVYSQLPRRTVPANLIIIVTMNQIILSVVEDGVSKRAVLNGLQSLYAKNIEITNCTPFSPSCHDNRRSYYLLLASVRS